MITDFIDASILLLVGRVLFGGFFLVMAMNHYMKTDMLVGYAESAGVPSAKLAVLLSGLLILGGGLGVILGVYVGYALLGIAVFLVLTMIMVHKFWAIEDPEKKMPEMVNFMKNMGFLGATLMMYSIPEVWAYSVTL